MKKKILTVLTFIYIWLDAAGQVSELKKYRICDFEVNGAVKEVFEAKKNSVIYRFVVFEKDGVSDTLCLPGETGTDSCRVNTIQINNYGQKEMMITWYFNYPEVEFLGNATNKMFRTFNIINEIWDLDSKKKIFSAVSSNKKEIVLNYLGMNYTSVVCGYDYDFLVRDDGKIVIDNTDILSSNSDYYCSVIKTDYQEGVYSFENGKFIRIDK
ncbi:MAG TPA: hypothetical protein PKN32_13035 [Bacteroidales bacterium]|nr:hypothetical protein [Bacteroidales bacterium]